MSKKKCGYEKLEAALSRASAELKFYWNSLSNERRDEFANDLNATLRTMLREFRRIYKLNKPELANEEKPETEPKEYEKLLGTMDEMQRAYLNMMEELVQIRRDQKSGHLEATMVLKKVEESQQRFEKTMHAYAQTGEGYTTSLRESIIAGVERLVAEREERFLRYLSERDKRLLGRLRQNDERKSNDRPDDSMNPRLVKTKTE